MINLDTPALTPVRRAKIEPHPGCLPEHINFVCVYWGTKYHKDYVYKLRSSILRNTDDFVDITFYCLSNEKFEGFEQIVPAYNWEGWWQKVQLFNPTIMPKGRTIYLDLDVVITGSLMDIINSRTEEPIVMIENFSMNRAQSAHNSSCMIWNSDDERVQKIYTEFNFEHVKNFIHGDQCWVWRVLKDHIANFNKDLIVSYKYHCQNGLPKNARVTVFHGLPNPHEVKDSWVRNNWK